MYSIKDNKRYRKRTIYRIRKVQAFNDFVCTFLIHTYRFYILKANIKKNYLRKPFDSSYGSFI